MRCDHNNAARVRLELIQHSVTLGDRGAYLVSPDGDSAQLLSLPKSQVIAVEFVRPGATGLPVNAYTIPRWLARDRGLLAARDRATGDLFGGTSNE